MYQLTIVSYFDMSIDVIDLRGSFTSYISFLVQKSLDQETLHHLRWMLQKDRLNQDIFLVGRPGPLKRRIAMQFLEATQRELEFVSLSRDTTESDLKQRREIESATAKYIDQVILLLNNTLISHFCYIMVNYKNNFPCHTEVLNNSIYCIKNLGTLIFFVPPGI